MWKCVLVLTIWVAVLGWTDARPGVNTDVPPRIKTSEPFNQSAVLDSDGNYILYWNFNDTSITFEVHVKTRGWVGFGLSANGNMFPGDVVVGWVTDDGTAHFTDRHTTEYAMPVVDAVQDWDLLMAAEDEFGTMLKFVRKIHTCDTIEDLEIPDGTVHVIFANHDEDPESDDAIMYHGTQRGTKSLYLLSKYREPEIPSDDVIHFDFLNQNFLLPNDTTTYQCRGFLMPDIGLHHLIKYEPIITPGNELNVHHIVLFRCPVSNPAKYDGVAGCSNVLGCGNPIIAWAIGSKAFYFPENVGLPIGGPGDRVFYNMVTHYNNPTQRTGFLDNSGLRMTLTKILRQYEADLLELGMYNGIVVPPNKQAFLSKGYCSDSCIRKGLENSGVEEIKLFGALQHAHLLAVGIKTRHFRNGVELKPLINDPAFSSAFQEMRLLPEQVSIYPGDSLSVECTYDSRSRTGPTFSGRSSNEEMCETFVYYYPKIALKHCSTSSTYDAYHLTDAELYHMFRTMDWNNTALAEKFQTKLDTSSVLQTCTGGHTDLNSGTEEQYVPKEPDAPYVPPQPACP